MDSSHVVGYYCRVRIVDTIFFSISRLRGRHAYTTIQKSKKINFDRFREKRDMG